jgi:hypothetical protein
VLVFPDDPATGESTPAEYRARLDAIARETAGSDILLLRYPHLGQTLDPDIRALFHPTLLDSSETVVLYRLTR